MISTSQLPLIIRRVGSVGRSGLQQGGPAPVPLQQGHLAANPDTRSRARAPQRTGTISGAPIRAASAVSSSGIRWLSRSASTRLT